MLTIINKTISEFFHIKFFLFLLLGLISGIPFLVILSTLSIRFLEEGLGIEVISFLSLTTIPYSLKFLWAKYLDITYIPYFSDHIGIRKAPLLITQLFLAFSIMLLGPLNVSNNILLTFTVSFFIAFLSANNDLLVDIFRIESIKIEEQHFAVTMNVIGYRLGMLVGGGGVLYLAAFQSWLVTYVCTGLIVVFLSILSIFMTDPPDVGKRNSILKNMFKTKITRAQVKQSFTNLLSTLNDKTILFIFLFILVFKLLDTVISFTVNPFLIEIGFNKEDIAKANGLLGTTVMCLGAFLGGLLINTIRIKMTIYVTFVFQFLCTVFFYFQSILEKSYIFLFAVQGFKGLTSGLVGVSLTAFLSYFCKERNVSSNIAFLSSYGSISRVFVTVLFGWISSYMTWNEFYLFVIILAFPSFLILLVIYKASKFKVF